MAFLADPIAPPPTTPGGGANQEAAANLAALLAGQQGQGASAKDPANIPLWMVRPDEPKLRTGGAGSANAAEHSGLGDVINDIASVGSFAGLSTPATKAFAEQHWLDMSEQDKQTFADAALGAGMWDPKQGAFSLAQAWTQAVDLAQQYNSSHDKKQWLSPYEAIQKLAPSVAASRQAKYNGFSETTHVTQFRESDLYAQAKSILQNNLGRDPTKEELHAFTLAVNEAAKKNPQVITSQQQNPDGSGQNQTVTYGGQFDPTQTIDEMVKNTDEYAKYQAAVDYFPAAMQALGAIV